MCIWCQGSVFYVLTKIVTSYHRIVSQHDICNIPAKNAYAAFIVFIQYHLFVYASMYAIYRNIVISLEKCVSGVNIL